MAQPCDRASSIAWIKRMLGCGVVRVELTNDQVGDAFDDAVRWWVGKRGLKKWAGTNIVSGQMEYVVPDDVDEVLEVVFPGLYLDSIAWSGEYYAYGDDGDYVYATSWFSGTPQTAFPGSYFQTIQHSEMVNRIFNAERAWEYDRNRKIITISPERQPSGSAFIHYISNTLTDEEFCKKILVRDRDIILRYAVVMAKQRLGRVRVKYQQWPSAGGMVSMDGDQLLGDVISELSILEEEIMGLSDAVPFVTG